MILCLGTTPAVQRAMIFDRLIINGVNRAAEVLEAAAGKSVNVARVLKVLGAEPLATGFLGGDRGEFLRGQLASAGIAHDFVTVQARTRLCVTLIDRAAQTHTELIEETHPVEPQAIPALRAKLIELLHHAKLLTLSGTLVPGASDDFYCDCTRLAADAGVPVVLDAHGLPLMTALPARPHVVKPNRAELSATLNADLNSESAIRDAMRRLIDLGARCAVITLGADGAIVTDGRRWWRIHAPPVRAVNSIGSGDAFAAGLAAGIIRGDDLPQACRLGAACGAANALTLLAGQVHLDDVSRLLPQVRVEPCST